MCGEEAADSLRAYAGLVSWSDPDAADRGGVDGHAHVRDHRNRCGPEQDLGRVIVRVLDEHESPLSFLGEAFMFDTRSVGGELKGVVVPVNTRMVQVVRRHPVGGKCGELGNGARPVLDASKFAEFDAVDGLRCGVERLVVKFDGVPVVWCVATPLAEKVAVIAEARDGNPEVVVDSVVHDLAELGDLIANFSGNAMKVVGGVERGVR